MKKFIISSMNPEKDGVTWNMIGSLITSFQSVIFMMIISRTIGLVASGIFSIAFANANLFLNVGKYGMRNYQVSDVNNEYNFKEYLSSRKITTGFMFVLSLLYTLFSAYNNGYSMEKTQIIIWMCILKMIDSIEDVYYGEYHKKGRLDVGAKILAVRMILTILVFFIVVIGSKSLLITVIVCTVLSAGIEVLFIKWTYPGFATNEKRDKRKVYELLKKCLPVALSSFCLFYAPNAPKYAIDAQLSDEIQACYGFISMPVFVIAMLNGFIFNPFLYKLSCVWNEKKYNLFVKGILRQSLIILIITCVCLLGGYLLGIPVLSLISGTNLSPYREELLILLVGGGFFALAGVLGSVVIIMRRQNAMLICYISMAVLAFLMSNWIVSKFQVMGAALMYMFLVIFLCMQLLWIIVRGVRAEKNSSS